MKLWLSKPKPGQKPHVVLDCTSSEDSDVVHVVREVVLGRLVKPIREQKGTKVRYRFHMKYLERLTLVFPFAEQSPAVARLLAKQHHELYSGDVPEIEIEGFKANLWDYQKIGVQRCIDGILADGHHMLNDEMGLGKTLMAIATIMKLDLFPALIVCPNNAKYVWEREFLKFTDIVPLVIEGNRGQRGADIGFHADVTICNFEQLRVATVGRGQDKEYTPVNPEFFELEYAVKVTDEFHVVKNPSSQQSTGWRMIEAENTLPMSGTPILNRAEEGWPVLNELLPDEYPDYHNFVRTILVPGKYGTNAYNPDTMSKLKKDIERLSTRRRKDQVLKDLPEAIPIDRYVELTGEQLRLYNRIDKEGKLELNSGESNPVHFRAQITRLRQAAFSPELYDGKAMSAKMDELKLIIKELVDNDEKAIIFSSWSKVTRIAQRELDKYNPAYVDGSVKGRKRMDQVDKFNEDDDCKLYIGTIGANKESITLSAATYVIFLDKAWSPLINDQAIARSAAGGLRGLGQKNPVHVISIIAKGTVDEAIEEMLVRKAKLFNSLIERDGGRKKKETVVAMPGLKDYKVILGLDKYEDAA